jgi:hypothetical protein
MMTILAARDGNAGLRVRSTLTTILLIDVLTRRRNRLDGRSRRGDISFAVR